MKNVGATKMHIKEIHKAPHSKTKESKNES